MTKLSLLEHSQTHRVLIFGGPKTGKSQLAGELAEYFNLMWVDLENGHEVLFKLPRAWRERIEILDIPDTRSYPIAIETVLKMVKGKVEVCNEHGKVNCMLCTRAIKDSLAEAASKEMKEEKRSGYFVSFDPMGFSSNDIVVFDSLTQLSNSAVAFITKSEPDNYKLTYDDWGNLGKLLDIFLSHIQQAGYNVIVISHEVEAETEGKKKTLVPVGGTRNFSRNVAKYFDHVVYAEKKNRKHVFASGTTYSTTILTGSRTDMAIEDLDVPSLLPIFKPELFKKPEVTPTGTKTKAPVPAKKPVRTMNQQTKAVLARLKAKKNSP